MVTKTRKSVAGDATRREPRAPARAAPKPRRAAKAAGETPRARSRRVVPESHRGLALAVLEQFRMIFRSVKKHFQWVQEKTGVSGAQIWVLAEIHRTPGIRVTELARAMAVHQSTASNLIDRLDKAGLIRRERSAVDQRVVHVSLTRTGQRTIAAAPRPLEGVLPDALNSLPRTNLLELKQHLDALARSMKVRDRGGKRIPMAEM
jgi:DNA-binding MarR family transcriptional regulator